MREKERKKERKKKKRVKRKIERGQELERDQLVETERQKGDTKGKKGTLNQ